MDTLTSAVALVSSQIGSLTCNALRDAHNKDDFAEKCGLTSIAEGNGSFAAMVAVHEDLPYIVIKVVPHFDMFLPFARECLEGRMDSPMLPTIHSITDMGNHSIVVVERIPHAIEFHGDADAEDEFDGMIWRFDNGKAEDEVEQHFLDLIQDFCDRHEGCNSDFHNGNFMRRDDGQLVCIDPVWSRKRKA